MRPSEITLKSWIQSTLGVLQRNFFPPICVLCQCDSDTRIDLCSYCRTELPWISSGCLICGIPLAVDHAICGNCQQQPPAFGSSLIPLEYRYPVAQLILQFKQHGNRMAGQVLAQLAADYISSRLSAENRPDVLIPVPLHPLDLRARGFNQAEVIAAIMAASLGLPLQTGSLRRLRQGTSQKSLGRRLRRANLGGVFEVTGSQDGLRVALVDDVVTTTATANELARLLLDAGARSVQIWALSRTPDYRQSH